MRSIVYRTAYGSAAFAIAALVLAWLVLGFQLEHSMRRFCGMTVGAPQCRI